MGESEVLALLSQESARRLANCARGGGWGWGWGDWEGGRDWGGEGGRWQAGRQVLRVRPMDRPGLWLLEMSDFAVGEEREGVHVRECPCAPQSCFSVL